MKIAAKTVLALATGSVFVFAASTSIAAEAAAASGLADVQGARQVETIDAQAAANLDTRLGRALRNAGFTGKFGLQETLTAKLGRPIDRKRAELGRLLWFDTAHSLHQDNTCGGCHAPSNGFGDSQPMAIGVDSNRVVGPDRVGPRNQRRSPLVVNNVFYPRLMWNARFSAVSGDPFDNAGGFEFPAPEGLDRFPSEAEAPAGDSRNLDARGITHLLQAQAHIPPTETVEVAGFNAICAQEGSDSPFCQFDHSAAVVGPERAHGLDLPAPVVDPETGGAFRNDPIRDRAVRTLQQIPEYVALFAAAFPGDPDPVNFDNFGKAIAEFEFTLTFANAPLDRFARGERAAMTEAQKRGALVFFGKGDCVACHQVAGAANEMFSDFRNHVIGVPQLVPSFGETTGNMIFDGPGKNEDFGQEQITGNAEHRYAFRTAPLRNLKLSPAFMHNGAFSRIEDAIRHHLHVSLSALAYDPAAAGVPLDLRRTGPILPVLLRVDPQVAIPKRLTRREVDDLITFVRDGLYDERAAPSRLCRLIPDRLPGGRSVQLLFQNCPPR